MSRKTGPYIPRQMPPPLAGLVGLALDLRWSWHHASDILWRTVDAQTWQAIPNAWLVLNSVSDQRLERLAEDPGFLALLQAQLDAQAEHRRSATWFSEDYAGPATGSIAFFCMEYALSESLPIYSGGLGVLAGDLLKTASDLGVPMVALGLLYQQGYFRQTINSAGEQLEFYPYNDPSMLPLSPLRDADGEWVRVIIELPGRSLRLRAWRGQVGRCELLLLDSNDPRNDPGDRGITSELYGGGEEKRLQQELVLGIGGWRLLEQLGIDCAVCHLNEGHSAFAPLERARSLMARAGLSFDAARHAVRGGTLFTTHTPVAAGFDRFAPSLIRQYLGDFAPTLGLSVEALLALGQENPRQPEGAFNMAYLALRMAGAVNAVSQIHQAVSRRILQPLFPRWPEAEVPVEVVTNGVHTPSWDSPQADALWTRVCGKERWRCTLEGLEAPLRAVDDQTLWQLRSDQRRQLIAFVRRRLVHQHCQQGGAPANSATNPDSLAISAANSVNTEDAGRCGLLLDEDALTLGFARRFTEYKRPDLLLYDPERLVRLLNAHDRPVQLIIAGKAHPRDGHGKAMLQQWQRFMQRPDVLGRIIFIADYDLRIGAALVQGVDVWLNSPRPPWEACGTSGMKVLVNGGLNLSQYDGWWGEAYDPALGWAIGAPAVGASEARPGSDADDARQLYECLEQEVIPRFYDCDAEGLPRAWIAMMRESMARLTPRYSGNRMLREYTERFYGPLAEAYRARLQTKTEDIAAWQAILDAHWRQVRFGQVLVSSVEDQHRFCVQVHLDGLEADWVRVELFAEADSGGNRSAANDQPSVAAVPLRLTRGERLAGSANAYNYHGVISADRSADDFTPRVIADHPLLRSPLELNYIHWQR